MIGDGCSRRPNMPIDRLWGIDPAPRSVMTHQNIDPPDYWVYSEGAMRWKPPEEAVDLSGPLPLLVEEPSPAACYITAS